MFMRVCGTLAIAAAAALSITSADAQYRPGGWYGPIVAPGSYYSYGADRANPSVAPNGWDLGSPRDFQLGGHN